MFSQYPHILTFQSDGTPDVWNEDQGGWTPGTQGSEVTLNCRAVPSGSGAIVKAKDGTDVKYSFDLVFPIDSPAIPQWRKVTITGVDGELLITDELKRYQRGQMLHHKGWI